MTRGDSMGNTMKRLTGLLAAILLSGGLLASAATASASSSPPSAPAAPAVRIPAGPAPAGMTKPMFNVSGWFRLQAVPPACSHGLGGWCTEYINENGHNNPYLLGGGGWQFTKINPDGPYVEIEDAHDWCLNTNGVVIGADTCYAGDPNELWYIFGPPYWVFENVHYSGEFMDAENCSYVCPSTVTLGDWYISWAAPPA